MMNQILPIRMVITVIIILVSISCFAQPRQKKILLALSKSEHVMAFIDPHSLKILARVPVGPDPHEVATSSDGRVAYVSNMGGGLHEMNVVDVVAQKALPSIDTKYFIGLHGLTYVGGKLWFTAEGSKAIGSIDASGQVVWAMGTGQDRTHMIYVTPDASRIYTTNVNAGTVSILVDTLQTMGPPPGMRGGQKSPSGSLPPGPPMGPRKSWIHTVIPVEKGSEGFDVTPDGKQLWTASSNGTISIIDPLAKKLITKFDAKVEGANRLKFTPDGKLVIISSLHTGDLFFFDVASQKEIKKINIGRGGAGVLIDTDGTRAFIGCSPDDYVAVVDIKKMELVNKISLGTPDGLAWAIVKE
ncbi:MAG: YncE family protein [Cytophagales bacterium]|jgi:DNA-binding beta-propeller fold protein YncE|nr:MAG: YncE family protein [Cytophagales bacterium]